MRIRVLVWTFAYLSVVTGMGCQLTGGHNLPPATQLAQPGPGVGGPGPGVLTPPMPPMGGGGGAYMDGGYAAIPPSGGGDVMTASYVEGGDAGCLGPGSAGMAPQNVQVLFARPEAMQIQWDVGGVGQYDSSPLMAPGRQNFQQGGIYRLKVSNLEGRPGVELYPTIEVGPPSQRTLAYLAHNAIPVQFTEEDFDQVLAGNFVTKVIYLPNPEYQALAVAGVETLVSTRLDAGQDPIVEADKKGTILAILRLGNKDMEMPGVDYGGDVMPASFSTPMGGGDCNACQGGNMPAGTTDMPPGGMPAGLVSGVNVPQYGMTMSGTPIGLPGPPHIPLGVPAGLQKHVIKNWTKQHIPDPVAKMKINVKQRPGLSYPKPANRAWITEETVHPNVHFGYQNFGQAPTGQVHQNCGPNGCY
ncbi:MAG: hypothetical protein KDA87_12250 [Planctomycetales bacterium]|nr:hypothetical protein [Planctomycetales bacterium]